MADQSLSRSLVDAAAEAVGDTTYEHMAHFGQVDCDACVARAAVAAVLETLAENGAVLEDHEGDWQAALRGLAAEVKEDTA